MYEGRSDGDFFFIMPPSCLCSCLPCVSSRALLFTGCASYFLSAFLFIFFFCSVMSSSRFSCNVTFSFQLHPASSLQSQLLLPFFSYGCSCTFALHALCSQNLFGSIFFCILLQTKISFLSVGLTLGATFSLFAAGGIVEQVVSFDGSHTDIFKKGSRGAAISDTGLCS